jgi:hypothetical protein
VRNGADGVDPVVERPDRGAAAKDRASGAGQCRDVGRWRSSPSMVLARVAELGGGVSTHSSKPGAAELAEPKPLAPRAPSADESCGPCREPSPAPLVGEPRAPTPPCSAHRLTSRILHNGDECAWDPGLRPLLQGVAIAILRCCNQCILML